VPVWSPNADQATTGPSTMCMQPDGSFALLSFEGTPLWASDAAVDPSLYPSPYSAGGWRPGPACRSPALGCLQRVQPALRGAEVAPPQQAAQASASRGLGQAAREAARAASSPATICAPSPSCRHRGWRLPGGARLRVPDGLHLQPRWLRATPSRHPLPSPLLPSPRQALALPPGKPAPRLCSCTCPPSSRSAAPMLHAADTGTAGPAAPRCAAACLLNRAPLGPRTCVRRTAGRAPARCATADHGSKAGPPPPLPLVSSSQLCLRCLRPPNPAAPPSHPQGPLTAPQDQRSPPLQAARGCRQDTCQEGGPPPPQGRRPQALPSPLPPPPAPEDRAPHAQGRRHPDPRHQDPRPCHQASGGRRRCRPPAGP
jgi:hypothetical protein